MLLRKPAAVATATLTLLAGLALGCSSQAPTPSGEPPRPPMAKVVPHALERHGDVRTDNYYWLKERDNPEVIAYLEAENAYTAAVMQHTEALQEKLFAEIVGRIKQTDESVPYKRDDYYYYTRVVEGGEYRLYCRKKGSPEAAEEIMLDANELASGHEFFSLRGLQVSSGQDLLAYAVDTVGRRFYTLRIKNLTTGEQLADTIPNVTGNVAWANDDQTLFYTRQDPETLRWHQVYRHVVGGDPARDELVYEEGDETFGVGVMKTRSQQYLMIVSAQTLSSEIRFLNADDPTGEFQILEQRQRDHEYSADHYGDHFYVRTNYQAKNFRLMTTPVTAPGRDHWQEVIPHRDDVYLNGFEIFRDHLVVSERRAGLIRLRIIPHAGEGEHDLDFGEPAYVAYPSDNYEFDTPVVRYRYSSLTTPWSTYDYNMETREKTLRKQDEVLGGFDAANYETERLLAPARDGKQIPVSVVCRRGTPRDGSRPLLLYGYGSYGFTIDPTFQAERLSLLDRGFIFAIAHVRGGQVFGRDWYEDGKLLRKMNTFTDFIDVGRYLVAQRYTRPDRLFAEGASAGGLLMGAVLNLAPELFHGIVAEVPFVDAITTMLDATIPLTSEEYDEWGDPNAKQYYDYILSYSPYDNVKARDYPHLLVTTGLHDSQVQYWEPAKWVAKLRATKTDDHRLLLKTNMEAGHGGASGRFKRHRETAFTYAFLLDLAGITE